MNTQPITGKCRLVVVVVAMLVAAAAGSGTALAYTGSLTNSLGGILGNGNWSVNPMSLSWDVQHRQDGSWLYQYAFTHARGETSHFVLETSSSFTENDLWGAIGSFGSYSVGLHHPGPGNPLMPERIYGIKFDEAWALTSTFSFYTWRAPVWGDFYAKNGHAGGLGQNAAWNAGFTVDDSDPLMAPADGSVGNHLLVPDTDGFMNPVPEPSSVLLMGAGCLGVAGIGVFRRRRARG